MRWLVRGIWPEKSYGVLAGEKKTPVLEGFISRKGRPFKAMLR